MDVYESVDSDLCVAIAQDPNTKKYTISTDVVVRENKE
jgi:hypothetical protein